MAIRVLDKLLSFVYEVTYDLGTLTMAQIREFWNNVEVNSFDNVMNYMHSYIDCNLCVPVFVVVSLYLPQLYFVAGNKHLIFKKTFTTQPV